MAPLPPFPWIDVLIILALVALNGAFAMSELAIVSARRARLEAMARSGRKGAQAALTLAAGDQRRMRAISGSTSGSAATVARTGCPKYSIDTGVPTEMNITASHTATAR